MNRKQYKKLIVILLAILGGMIVYACGMYGLKCALSSSNNQRSETTSPDESLVPEETATSTGVNESSCPEESISPASSIQPETTTTATGTPAPSISPEQSVLPTTGATTAPTEEQTQSSTEVPVSSIVTPQATENSNQNSSHGDEETTSNQSGIPVVSYCTYYNRQRITQRYTITCSGDNSIDTSKIAIRFNYSCRNISEQEMQCNSGGITYNRSPWYTECSSKIRAYFGNNFVKITIAESYTLCPNQDTLVFEVSYTQKGWGSYDKFEDKGIQVFYNNVQVN